MTNIKEWPCEHIREDQGKWRWCKFHYGEIIDLVICCPYCESKRPEEELVDLWTLILPFHKKEVCKELMARVIEHFIKEISYIGVSNPESFSTEVFRLLNKELDKCK